MMKKILLVLTVASGAIALQLSPSAQAAPSTEAVQSRSDGLHVGGKTTDRIGFYNATPTAQQANTVTPFAALQAIGILAAGGSDPYVTPANNPVVHIQVAVPSATILTLYDTPLQLVAAPGAGKSIVVAKAAFTIVRSATAYASGGAGIIQYDSTVHGGGTQACDSTIASTVVTGAAGTSVTIRNGAVISDLASTSIQNKGLFISNATGDFTTGTGTATVDIWYYVY